LKEAPKMTFNKKLIAGAVGTALTLGLGMQAAQANHVMLFPYVVKDTNRTTVITVIGQADSNGSTVHLQYWTKDASAANTAACQPNSSEIKITDNDIATWDTAGLLGYPLFGDTTNAAPLGTTISYAGPRHGYLVVEQNEGYYFDAGYWLELDLANGGAHGDMAVDNTGADSPSDFQYVTGWWSLRANETGEHYNARAVPFWPSSIGTSAFTVTPLGTQMRTDDNSQVVMQIYNHTGVQGAYDRNENGIDGTVPQTVRCVGKLTAAQLMPGVVANAAWAATGGWGFLTNLGNGDANNDNNTTDRRAMVYQVDTSNAAGAGKFMSNATRLSSYPCSSCN